jgi:hypothetical protein
MVTPQSLALHVKHAHLHHLGVSVQSTCRVHSFDICQFNQANGKYSEKKVS